MNKAIIRERVKEKIQAIPSTLKEKYEQNLYEQLFETSEWNNAQTVGVTLSMGAEINTSPLIQEARKSNKTICVPRTGEEMSFHLYETEEELALHPFGMLEPKDSAPLIDASEIDLLIVPGVAFSTNGYRIGYGGGYYDRYLAHYNGATFSLLYPEQVDEEVSLFVESHDQPVQKLLIAINSRILDEER